MPAEALRVLVGLTERATLDLRLLGRALLHATAVGRDRGAGRAFFAERCGLTQSWTRAERETWWTNSAVSSDRRQPGPSRGVTGCRRS
jgi:hypothetical protein